jgi:hypothetical protein
MVGIRKRGMIGRNRFAWLLKLALLAGSTLACLAAIEIFFRIFLLDHVPAKTQREFNHYISSGWPRPIPIKKDPGIFRILGLADSFGVAGGHQNYHYLLETLLKKSGMNAEVVNLSEPCLSPRHELILFRRFGTRYHPDLVIQSFCIGNDFTDPREPYFSYRGIPIFPQYDKFARILTFPVWLRGLQESHHNDVATLNEIKQGRQVGSFAPQIFLQIVGNRLDICRTVTPWAEYQQVLEDIDETRKEAEKNGAKYLLVLNPDQYQVEKDLWREVQQKYHLSRGEYDLERPQKVLKAFCASRGINCLDLLGSFRKIGARGSLYLLRDTHYNLEGNKVEAQNIFKFLAMKKGLNTRLSHVSF